MTESIEIINCNLEQPDADLTEKKQPTHLSSRLLGKFSVGCAVAISTLAWTIGRYPGAEASSNVPPTYSVPLCALPLQTAKEQKNAIRDRIHVVGNHEKDGFGKTWTPYGISVFGGLQDGDSNAAWQPTIGASMAQIEAAPFWHANTIRLQWNENNIFNDISPGAGINVPFLMALCKQVQQIRKQGEVAVLNDNNEFPNWGEYNPTPRTVSAWQVIFKEFGNQPGLIYESFNEPREELSYVGKKRTPANVDWLWHLWRDGGQAGSKQFVGIQQLVNDLRSFGYKNEIWIDPPMLEDLDKYRQFSIHDPAQDIVPTFHHSKLPLAAASGDTRDWYRSFGYLTKRYPVVDGEWNQAAAPTPECNPNAYRVVPAYLRYLRTMRIGLLVWSLQAGSMVKEKPAQHHRATNTNKPYEPTNPSALMHPSQMHPNYTCDAQHVGEGTGQWILNYFRANSKL